jgi:hypothetical protein
MNSLLLLASIKFYVSFVSGVSSVSSATNGSLGSTKSGKCTGLRMSYPRQPTGSLRKSQTQAMKVC